ncbi:MAG: YbbR-like domain-containing protein [Acidobacteria bacterium]|nr:YbbR-like domain-containing protein [Acidobacteriota bacterium]
MKRLFTHNLPTKLASLALATLFWVLVVGEQEVNTSVAAPIQLRNLPKDLEMSSDLQENVHLEIRGSSSRLTPGNLAATVVTLDLSSVSRPGDRTFPIDSRSAVLPAGVTLIRAVPSLVRLHFERRMSKEVPVKVKFSGSLPAGVELGQVSVEPASIRLLGPESRVSDETAVETDPVELGDLNEGGAVQVQVYSGDSQVRIEGDGRVTVRVELKKDN